MSTVKQITASLKLVSTAIGRAPIRKILGHGFFISCLALSACGKKDSSSTSTTFRGTGPRTQSAGSTFGAQSLVGTVSADSSYQAQFQKTVSGFISTDINPLYVGTIPAQPTATSGVHFGGNVTLTTGSLRNYSGQTAQISANSSFTIQVLDVNSSYSNVPLLPPFHLSNATGSITGSAVTLQFSDQWGSVMLQGTLDSSSNMFSGAISFDNRILYDNSTPGAAGTMGNFSIPMCQFFNCN